jgi:RimJ/RimL family protein N-acetyltransferase
MLPVEIKTLRLMLRPFPRDDAPAVLEYWRSDADWSKFNASVPSDFSENDAINFAVEMSERDRESRPNWAIVYCGQVSGIVSLSFEQDHQICVLGYGIHGQSRRRYLLPHVGSF